MTPNSQGFPKNRSIETGKSATSSANGDLILNSLPTVIIPKIDKALFPRTKKIRKGCSKAKLINSTYLSAS